MKGFARTTTGIVRTQRAHACEFVRSRALVRASEPEQVAQVTVAAEVIPDQESSREREERGESSSS